MAAKPTDLPEWATDPGADIEEPPPGKKATGWAPLEKPPHQWFNWFFGLVFRWCAFVNDYSANHKHDGGTSDLSAPKINPNAEIDWSTPVTGQDVTIGGTEIIGAVGSLGIDTTRTIRAVTSGSVFSRIEPNGTGTFSEKLQVGYPIKATIHGDTGLVDAPNTPKIVTEVTKGGGLGSYSVGVSAIGSPNSGEYQIHPTEPLTSSACVILASIRRVAGDPILDQNVIILTGTTPDGSGGYYPTIQMFDQQGLPAEVALNVTVYY